MSLLRPGVIKQHKPITLRIQAYVDFFTSVTQGEMIRMLTATVKYLTLQFVQANVMLIVLQCSSESGSF